MDDHPEVPPALRERMEAAQRIGGRGVGEVFYGSNLREGCPACGESMTFRTVYYTVSGEPDVPISQQTKHEVAHEYVCTNYSEHDENYLWVVDVQGGNEWHFGGVL